MKTKTSNGGSNRSRRPRYSLRKHIAFWGLTFEGRDAVFDHEQGAYYVAYLLLHRPAEPIHGMALELKANATYRPLPGESLFRNPQTGVLDALPIDAFLQQRSLRLDDAEAAFALRRTQQKLEAVLDNEDEVESVKTEAMHQLEVIYEFQKKHPTLSRDDAQRAVRAVRAAISRFRDTLVSAVDAHGERHTILRRFGQHLEKTLIIPSARYSKAQDDSTRAGIAGCFVYEPPRNITWHE